MQTLPEPYYTDDYCTIYHGDSRELLPLIDADVMVTDPPYGIAYVGYGSVNNVDMIVGDDKTDLLRFALAQEIPRVVFGAENTLDAIPTNVAWLVWDKRCNDAADRAIGAPFEMGIAIGTKSTARSMYRIMHGGPVNSDGHGKKRDHPTQKPLRLMQRVINDYAPTGVIVDPFMGSGTTLRAAKNLGRKCIGIEVEEKWCKVALERLAQENLFTEGAA